MKVRTPPHLLQSKHTKIILGGLIPDRYSILRGVVPENVMITEVLEPHQTDSGTESTSNFTDEMEETEPTECAQ